MKSLLSESEIQRYSRHLLLGEVGLKGQEKLKRSSVLIVGAGGLGSPAALYLAAAGVGHLTLIDFDNVDVTNLQRQVLFDTKDVGHSKAARAAARLKALNPEIEIEFFNEKLSGLNIRQLIKKAEVIIDGSDNFVVRYLVNDACVLEKKWLVSAAIFRFEAQLSVFAGPGSGPCYRCLYEKPPAAEDAPNCAEAGVLGALPGVVGALQATEALKLILGIGESLQGRLLSYEALEMKFREFPLQKKKGCAVCGENPWIREVVEEVLVCASPLVKEISAQDLKKKLGFIFLIDVRTQEERGICLIQEAKHFPLAELEQRLQQIPKDQEIVIHCKSGARSLKACEILLKNGFKNVSNLKGGILNWIDTVDSSLNRY